MLRVVAIYSLTTEIGKPLCKDLSTANEAIVAAAECSYGTGSGLPSLIAVIQAKTSASKARMLNQVSRTGTEIMRHKGLTCGSIF